MFKSQFKNILGEDLGVVGQTELYDKLSLEEKWILKYFQTARAYALGESQEMQLVDEFKKHFDIDVLNLESNLING